MANADHTPRRARIDWQDAPYVFVTVALCPSCGSARKPDIVRSESQGDGSVTRKCICLDCDEPFRLVMELPETGSSEE